MTIFFFFKCYGAHRDLLSSPTRRSPDLDLATDAGFHRHGAAYFACRDALALAKKDATPLRKPKPTPTPDRKSTRLNSSHSQISYAVFCLKKKKNHDSTHTNNEYNQTAHH